MAHQHDSVRALSVTAYQRITDLAAVVAFHRHAQALKILLYLRIEGVYIVPVPAAAGQIHILLELGKHFI